MGKIKRVVIFGNQQICVDGINLISKNKDATLLVVVGCETQIDKKNGYPSIKEYCQNKGIRYLNPEILDDKFLKLLQQMEPDLCFSLYYRKIFKSALLNIPKFGFINLHGSLLPKYRGPAPSLWITLNREKTTGLTLHYMDDGVDTGDIIAQIKFPVPKDITGYELNRLNMKKGADLFKLQLPLLLQRKNKRIPQDHKKATYYGTFRESVRKINWFESAVKICSRVRALTKPYTGAVTMINDQEITIWSAAVIKSLKDTNLKGPGIITRIIDEDSFIVSSIDGYILINNFTLNQNIEAKEVIKIGERFDI